MALRKNITLPSALVVTYHRIAGFQILDRERICEVHVEHFKDEDTRRAVVEKDGQEVPAFVPASTSVARLQGAHFNALFGAGVPEYPSKADLYAYLKTEPFYAGAVDVE